jgi:hypothetical protein
VTPHAGPAPQTGPAMQPGAGARRGGPAGFTFTVDPWDPAYGMAFGDELDGGSLQASDAELSLDLELPADQWRPVDPDLAAALPGTVLFLDGVRRIDARVWVHGNGPQPAPGIAASFAAGLVRCDDDGAHITEVLAERGLFSSAAHAADIGTRYTVYPARMAEGPGADKLSLALQQRLTGAEVELANAFRARNHGGDDLLVVDGPLRGRTHLDRTVGYIKTHHAAYLPAGPAAVIGALRPGQRSPVFMMGTSWRRSSWYLQLPGAQGAPWAGVVRLECSADLSPAQAVALADLTARLLPPLASAPHKDSRAPQNLVPIGGLERELRRRLGDQQLLYRALRAAASG